MIHRPAGPVSRPEALVSGKFWLRDVTNPSPAYSDLMLDYAAGGLSPGERLAVELHRALSASGALEAAMLDASGGALLEELAPTHIAAPPVPSDAARPSSKRRPGEEVGLPVSAGLLAHDLLALDWKRTIFGVREAKTGVPHTRLLRLDPGEKAMAHHHGLRETTVVLRGSFADEMGTYSVGDLAVIPPGVKHRPRIVGDEPCVCLLATEPGPGWVEFLGLLGVISAKRLEAA